MHARTLFVVLATALGASFAQAQAPATAPTAAPVVPSWRPPGASTASEGNVTPPARLDGTAATIGAPVAAPGEVRTASLPQQASLTSVTKGSGTLPNDKGQVWREYDISPYTLRVTSTNRPEQAIVDWILRETGYEAWHSETVAMLSADRRSLRVYHTPAMQQTVNDIVDRFVNTRAESHAFGLQIMTLSSPNWRARAQTMLHPVQVQTAGVQAWLLAKEDAATLLADLGRRSDFRTHSSPHLLVNNGQAAVVTLGQPRNYVRGLIQTDARVGAQPDVGQVFEGFSMELNPLLSIDGRMIDAVVKCNVDQIEKMIPVQLDVPGMAPSRQLMTIEVPQLSGTRLQERFRWPTDKVLLLSMGVVPSPMPGARGAISWPLTNSAPRADLLILIESRGSVTAAASGAAAAAVPAPPTATRFVR